MARNYAKISTTLWQSKKFRSLAGNDHARLFYLYLHSCNQVNSVGCFRLPLGYAVTDTGWSEAAVLEAINSLSEANLIEWDTEECSVRIVGFIDHDQPTNPKHFGAMASVAKSLPDGAQKVKVITDLLAQPHIGDKKAELTELRDRLSIAYKEAIPPFPYPIPEPIPSSLRSDGAPQAASPPKRERKVSTSLPDDCPTESDREAALTFWRDRGRDDLCARLDDEIIAFRAHHAGHGNRMSNWSQAWVTWYGKAIKFNRKPDEKRDFGRSKQSATDQHLAGMAEIVSDIRAGRG
jgi:hypothetical protein